jgi:membrane fusion protein (multidrug efflux system)
MAKKIALTAVGLLVLVGALAGVKVMQFKTMFAQASSMTPPPTVVAVSDVQRVSWRPVIESVGTVVPRHGVQLSAEVAGTVKRIAFDSGTSVKAGAVLCELDSASEQAQLQSAEASAELARVQLERNRALRGDDAVAQSQLDSAEAEAKQKTALVAQLRAEIAKKTIRAPFAGKLGMWPVNLGQFVNNGTPLITVLALDPVYVDFTLPQQRVSELRVGLTVRVRSDASLKQVFEGTLSVIDVGLDPQTRSLQLRATFTNHEGLLRPGMFTHVEVVLPDAEQVLAIPATAVIYAPYGNSVFVVEKPKTGAPIARQHFVRLGATRGDFVAVTRGLAVGDTIVTTGAFKLRNGMPLAINNALKPETSFTPSLEDN